MGKKRLKGKKGTFFMITRQGATGSSKATMKFLLLKLSPNNRINLGNIPLLPDPRAAKTKTFLLYKGIPFILKICPVIRITNKKGYIARVPTQEGTGIAVFKDKRTGKIIEKKSYSIIELDPKVTPQCLMDVMFFHELRELYYREKLGYPDEVAHKKARKDEIKYVNKFLSSKEKEIYQKFMKEQKPLLQKLSDLEKDLKGKIYQF